LSSITRYTSGLPVVTGRPMSDPAMGVGVAGTTAVGVGVAGWQAVRPIMSSTHKWIQQQRATCIFTAAILATATITAL
jgi:hypothetical protein